MSDCTHPDGHWRIIAPPDGPTSPARCKRCGLESDERNSLDSLTRWATRINDTLRDDENAKVGRIVDGYLKGKR